LAAHLQSVWRSVGPFTIHARRSVLPIEGEPVILVHGLGVSSLYMVPTAQRLAPFHRVYAPDLPGFGHSSKPRRALDIPALAGVLADWLDVMRLERVAMVGNSLGCQVIAEFGLHHPDRLARAVLQGPTIDDTARTLRQQVGRFVRDLPREKAPEYLLNSFDYWRCGIRRGLETMNFALQDRIENKMPHLRMPVLIVRGRRDPIVRQPWADRLAFLSPDGYLTTVKGAHTPNFSEPDAFVDAIQPFLSSRSSRI
jgi:2-hydroxy-6-oxonona-2,4-dienedioate hydrolase